MPINALFAGWSNDPFVETIERHLHVALTAGGGRLLRVIEGRSPADDDISTIDLDDPVQVKAAEASPIGNAELPPAFDAIIEDTIWFERTAGLAVEPVEVRNRLRVISRHIHAIFRSWPCDAVLVWNGLLSQRALIAAVARQMQIPVWHCERGPLPGSWYADPVGINGNSGLVEEPLAPKLAEALASPLPPDRRTEVLAELNVLSRRGQSAWEQPGIEGGVIWRQRLDIPDGKRVAFFPMQVDADTNMRFFSPHFSSSVAALRAVVDTLAGDDRWYLLVKPHPKGSYDRAEIENMLANVNGRLCDLNIQDALSLASVVVTINSTTAAEAVWQDRPVLQLGRGILSGKRIVAEYDPRLPLANQLDDTTQQWHDERDRYERGLCFYDFLRRDYLLEADGARDAARLIARIDQSTVKGPAERESGGDPSGISGCFAWRPAVELIRRIRSRTSPPERVLLLGFGQNARRLLHAARLTPGGVPWQWTIWDDDPARRQQATCVQLAIEDPFGSGTGEDVQITNRKHRLIVVTPHAPEGLEARLIAGGLRRGQDYLCIATTHKIPVSPTSPV